MFKDQQLMSQKEKDYIAYCFNKTANSLKTDINYEDILNGEKIQYDLKEGKKEFKMVFGKSYKRSRKHCRPSSNTETTFFNDNLMITQLYETLNILKYLKIDDESLEEISNSINVHFKNNFSIVIKNNKIYDFLEKFIFISSDNLKVEIMSHFYKNSDCIVNCDLLFNFLDKNLKMLPVKSKFITKALFRSNSGCLLAFFLLLKDQSLFNKIYESFLISKVLDCEYLHKFITVLISMCDKKQKSIIKEKLKRESINNINLLMGDLSVSN